MPRCTSLSFIITAHEKAPHPPFLSIDFSQRVVANPYPVRILFLISHLILSKFLLHSPSKFLQHSPHHRHSTLSFFFMMPDMNAAEERTSLEQASALVNSALSSTYSIRSFSVKWQSIRSKLEHLHSCLTSASADGDSVGNSALTKLLQDISVTAKDAGLLTRRCTGDSCGGGKLLMKSDLDVIAARLQLHIKHLDETYASGILKSTQAIVLCKPGTGASREDMRLYVKDLFSRLRIGDMQMRARALAALNVVLKEEDDKYVRIVAAEAVEGASILVHLLDFRDMTVIQQESLEAVSVVAGFESCRGMLVMAGVIPPLIRVLQSGRSELAKERAAQAMKQMTENCNNAWLVSSQGGITALLNICNDDSSTCKLIALACGVLRNISGVSEIKRFIVEEGAIPPFLKLMKSKEEVLQIQAMELLYKVLASEDEAVKQESVDSLLNVMNPSSLYSSKVREIALRAIEGFCFTSTNAAKHLLNSGFLDRVLFLLRHGEALDQESALKTVSRFCEISDEAKKAMGGMGFMPELLRMLEAGSSVVGETAAETLCSLLLLQKNRRRFILEDSGNIDRVLRLLNPEEGKPLLKKLLLSALTSLTDSNTGRRKVAASSYVRNLEKLAETDMIEAKRILKRITSNRFRSMFNGIWGS